MCLSKKASFMISAGRGRKTPDLGLQPIDERPAPAPRHGARTGSPGESRYGHRAGSPGEARLRSKDTSPR